MIDDPDVPNENWGFDPELLPGGLIFKKAEPPPKPDDDEDVMVVDNVEGTADSLSAFLAPNTDDAVCINITRI